jgi:hypothetical protein
MPNEAQLDAEVKSTLSVSASETYETPFPSLVRPLSDANATVWIIPCRISWSASETCSQTWFGRRAGRFQIACSAAPNAFLPDFIERRGGTRCPSSRHSRSIRLRMIRQPSSLSSAHNRR